MIGSSRPMVSKLIGDMLQEGVLARAERRHFIVRAPLNSSLASEQQPAIRSNGTNKPKRLAGDHLTHPLSARG
jgi:hypothetical protein